uniref:RING-type domain-containing protein n=1 Tax=Spongospora subterranea TaxID=70186 RepID=A0A0H5R675_9EUKA|eukprot:CRZ09655.1 hypothetical protein [Spongospora subterranea]
MMTTTYHPIVIYTMISCALVAVTISPMPPRSGLALLLVSLSSPVNAFIAFNFFFMFVLVIAYCTLRIVFGEMSDDEQTSAKEHLRNFLMFKSMYLFSALHNAQYTDLVIWLAVFVVFGWFRTFVSLGYQRLTHRDPQQQTGAIPQPYLLLFISLVSVLNCSTMIYLGNIFSEIGWRPLSILLHEGCLTLVTSITCMLIYFARETDSGDVVDQSQSTFYIESCGDIVNNGLTLLHLIHVWSLHGLSLTVIDMFFFMITRTVYIRLSSRVAALIIYRRVIRDINTRFSDASEQELRDLDDHCTICHEPLQTGQTKKLPCSHFFHLSCLRQWMKYRRTCPICRSDLLSTGVGNTGPVPESRAAVGQRRLQHPWGLRRLFRFNTGDWAAWLPTVSFEIVRGAQIPVVQRRPPYNQLGELFPDISEAVLQRYLLQANGVVAIAADNIINRYSDGAIALANRPASSQETTRSAFDPVATNAFLPSSTPTNTNASQAADIPDADVSPSASGHSPADSLQTTVISASDSSQPATTIDAQAQGLSSETPVNERIVNTASSEPISAAANGRQDTVETQDIAENRRSDGQNDTDLTRGVFDIP